MATGSSGSTSPSPAPSRHRKWPRPRRKCEGPDTGSGDGSGDINCDQGAREGLGLRPEIPYYAVAIYFRTRREAQQFVDAFQPGVVGTAAVTLYCLD